MFALKLALTAFMSLYIFGHYDNDWIFFVI